MKATAGPWEHKGNWVVSGPFHIAMISCPATNPELHRANAALIVRAVNAHDKLVKAGQAMWQGWRDGDGLKMQAAALDLQYALQVARGEREATP